MDGAGFDFDLNLVLIGAVLALIGAVVGAAGGWIRHGHNGIARTAAMGAFVLPVLCLFGIFWGSVIVAFAIVGVFGFLLG